jgi:small subunit ribosomal protein S1
MEEKQVNEVASEEEGAVEQQAEEQPESIAQEEAAGEQQAEEQPESIAQEEAGVEQQAEEQPESVAQEAAAVEQQAEEQPESVAQEEAEAEQQAEEQPESVVQEEAAVEQQAEEQPESVAQEEAAVEQQAEEQPESVAQEEAEAEQQTDEHPMSALMEEALSFQRLKRGDIVDGEIVSVTPTEVLVDVGAKSEGVVPSKELERLGRQGLEDLKPGDTLSVYVVKAEDRDGNLILSIRRAEEESDWRRAQELHESGEWFESQVAGFNKGGLIVRLGRLRGFVPASQLSPAHQGSNKQQPEERWARLVGEPVRVKVIEFNRKRKRLILSERAAMRQWREVQKERLLDELRVGEVRQGVVSSLSDFGAFVDLGGADGLVHLSELSWNRSTKPGDLLQVGQKVDVYILGVDQDRKRIALSLKRLEPEPWSTVEDRYYVGQLVEGTITRLTNFGAFALVNDEIEGLIHISELSPDRINHPQDVVSESEKHVMRIIRIDAKRRRMGLSLSRVADPAYADLDWRAELAEAEASYEYDDTEDLMEEIDALSEGDEESR